MNNNHVSVSFGLCEYLLLQKSMICKRVVLHMFSHMLQKTHINISFIRKKVVVLYYLPQVIKESSLHIVFNNFLISAIVFQNMYYSAMGVTTY